MEGSWRGLGAAAVLVQGTLVVNKPSSLQDNSLRWRETGGKSVQIEQIKKNYNGEKGRVYKTKGEGKGIQ